MKHSVIVILALAASVAVAQAAETKKKQRSQEAQPAWQVGQIGTFSQDPPRMIEIRPGYWMSSWGCVVDEGQGRLRDCNAGGPND